jgi:hypothetical protein
MAAASMARSQNFLKGFTLFNLASNGLAFSGAFVPLR